MTNVKHIKDYLLEATFFEGMQKEYLELIAGCGQLVHFKANEIIAKEGDDANSFYVIREGDVAVESHMPGGVLMIGKVGAEGVVCYSWLFPPYRTDFDIRAVGEVKAIKLDGACLRGKAEQDHELGYQFMKRFAAIMLRLMQSTRRQMLDIYGHDAGKA